MAIGNRWDLGIAPVMQQALQVRRCSDKVNTLLKGRFLSPGTFAVLAVSN
jgi:hypothetical protein